MASDASGGDAPPTIELEPEQVYGYFEDFTCPRCAHDDFRLVLTAWDPRIEQPGLPPNTVSRAQKTAVNGEKLTRIACTECDYCADVVNETRKAVKIRESGIDRAWGCEDRDLLDRLPDHWRQDYRAVFCGTDPMSCEERANERKERAHRHIQRNAGRMPLHNLVDESDDISADVDEVRRNVQKAADRLRELYELHEEPTADD